MKGVVLAQGVVRGHNLVGFDDGSVKLVSSIMKIDQSSEYDYLQLPPRDAKEREVIVIRKIGPYQEGEARITLKRFRQLTASNAFEFIGAYDPGERIWAYVTNSFRHEPAYALTN